jgi:hypothetical protein
MYLKEQLEEQYQKTAINTLSYSKHDLLRIGRKLVKSRNRLRDRKVKEGEAENQFTPEVRMHYLDSKFKLNQAMLLKNRRCARALHLLRGWKSGRPYKKVENEIRSCSLPPERVVFEYNYKPMSLCDFLAFKEWTEVPAPTTEG